MIVLWVYISVCGVNILEVCRLEYGDNFVVDNLYFLECVWLVEWFVVVIWEMVIVDGYGEIMNDGDVGWRVEKWE